MGPDVSAFEIAGHVPHRRTRDEERDKCKNIAAANLAQLPPKHQKNSRRQGGGDRFAQQRKYKVCEGKKIVLAVFTA